MRPVAEIRIELNSRWVIARGLLSVLFGGIALTWPGVTLVAVSLFFGIYALTDGIIALGSGIRAGRHHEPYGMALFEGVIGIGAGLLTLFWPKMTLVVLSILTGVWALATGCLEVLAAFEFSRIIQVESSTPHPPGVARGIQWGRFILVFMGVCSIGLGVSIFIWPVLGAITLVTLIASYAIAFGALTTAFGFHLRKLEKLVSAPQKPAQAA